MLKKGSLMQIKKYLNPAVLVLCLLLAWTVHGVSEDAPSGMRIEDGMARQIVSYTSAQDLNYSNDGSEILRFVVYVETDYDTDLDGKPDLIKTVVQVPRPAAEGVYQAPIIYEARPYIAGIDLYQPELPDPGQSDFNPDQLRTQPPKRIPQGDMSTMEAALHATPSDWFYKFEHDFYDLQYMQNLTTYDDLLVCGFAVVQSAGLGTWGSEGIECCGSDLEAEAFKCVVEWLTGKRCAYTDKTSNIQITADWSSGSVGMTGRSYAGAMAFEVASTGVEGLKTIVPVAGPASWYAYANSQGMPTGLYDTYGTISNLAKMCASRFFEGADAELASVYEQYLASLRDQEILLQGDFGPYWAEHDYSECSGFKASALIVQGLNDITVHPDQFDRMRSTLLNSGCEVKSILHQNGHVTPANEQARTDILIGSHTYTEWLNLWFTHYLVGIDNDAASLPSLTVQSNLDGVFRASDEWNTGSIISFSPEDSSDYTVHAENAQMANPDLLSTTFNGTSGPDHLLWKLDVPKPLTINGNVKVHLRVKTSDTDKGLLMLGAVLVDQADEPFHSYGQGWSEVLDQSVVSENGVNRGEGVTPYSLVTWDPSFVTRKIIAYGTMDLRNPLADYAPSTAAPADSIQPDTWYDYTLYLEPNFYTVAEGHSLELYIVPFCGFSNNSAFYDLYHSSEEDLTSLGFNPATMIPFLRNYSFTVAQGFSSVDIPAAENAMQALHDSF